MLDCLVLPNRPAEHDALLGIATSARKRRATNADRFGGHENPFRVHPMQDIFEASALLADQVLSRHWHGIEKELVGVDSLAAHLVDHARLHVLTFEAGVKQR